MMLSKDALQKIKKIIENSYNELLVSVAGTSVLTESELDDLRDLGVSPEKNSLLTLLYYNNLLNDLTSTTAPTSVPDMERQQRSAPTEPHQLQAIEHLNENFAQTTRKISSDIQGKVEGLIREYNLSIRNKKLADNLPTEGQTARLMQDSTVGGLRQALRDMTEDANRNWSRVAITETANALGLGSIDRVTAENKDKDIAEVYVFRIPVDDAALCKKCKQFYLDTDRSPVVYRLSTLLANGTNNGKKMDNWRPVATATHPNDRESGVIELKPGWKVRPGGSLEFIGLDAWPAYINAKLRE